jgi:hypothetical protein
MTRAGLLLPTQAFSQLPTKLRDDLLNAFALIIGNFAEGRWEPAELNGGKLCEAAYSICEGLASGTMPNRASKPQSMVHACQALEKTPGTDAPRSVRIQIPRMLVSLYEIRNNRNVGHVGGDVDPNHMDAVCVLEMSKWIVAELVRVLHQLPVDEAADLVDALVEREVPLVWKVGGKKRILDPKMSMKNKTLLLLHSSAIPVAEEEIFGWVEHSNASVYRRDVLRRVHRAKLVEYDADAKTVALSPTGVAYVEQKLIGTRA